MAKRKPAPTQPQPETAGSSANLLLQHAWWVAPFVVFLIFRLFCGDPYYQLGGDQCTFLQLARTFPKHQLYNHETYLIHSPLFGWTIGVFQLVLPLLTAGLVVVLLFACLNFFVLRKFALFENLPRPAIFAGLLYLAISRPAVAYDYHVTRVSILVCATAFALLAFLRLLEQPSRNALLIAVAANVFALFVSDQSLLLLPCEALLFWFRGSRAQWKAALLVLACGAFAAAIWPSVRLFEFLHRPDLPAGIDGTIEFTQNLSWKAVIQPNFLPFTNIHRSLFTETSLSLANLKLGDLSLLPADLLLLPRVASAILVLSLIAAALVRRDTRSRSLQWLALSVIFLLPVGIGMNEWYSMGFIVPFTLLIMEGAAACLLWAQAFKYVGGYAIAGLSVACAAAAILWLNAPVPPIHAVVQPPGGKYFLFTRPPLTRGSTIAKFFASMPRDTGIMAPVDLSPEIVYLTDKRVVALPFNPVFLDRFIAEYNISYLLTSSQFFREYSPLLIEQFTGALITRYIVQHPERYPVVQGIHEIYPGAYDPADFFVLDARSPEFHHAQ